MRYVTLSPIIILTVLRNASEMSVRQPSWNGQRAMLAYAFA